jgi:formylglycine-generating enzyme required for sulfatase activity
MRTNRIASTNRLSAALAVVLLAISLLQAIPIWAAEPRRGGQKSLQATKRGTQEFATPLESPPQGNLLPTSCAPGEISMEDKEFGHGVFLHFVLEGLKRKADTDGDRKVSPAELDKFTNVQMNAFVAKKFNDSQRPSLRGSLDDEFDIVTVIARVDRSLTTQDERPQQPVPQPAGGTDPDPLPVVEVKPGPVITNSIGMKLALIPAGEFLMGSPQGESGQGDDEKQHRVRITKPFYLGVYEVTLDEFLKFYHAAHYESRWRLRGNESLIGLKLTNGKYAFDAGKQYVPWSWGHPDQTPQHPVVNVNWNDAVAFCEWLSQKEAKRYRLPTEAEWEYACRAGTTTRFSNGDDEEGLLVVANVADATLREAFNGASGGAKGRDGFPFTAPVGQFKPNGFGLYDMHGNAWEWCSNWSDWYDKDYYKKSPIDDPRGPSAGASRVLRGGGWYGSPMYCRSAYRYSNAPSYRLYNYGFRAVCEVE